jgi:hypothetical protein
LSEAGGNPPPHISGRIFDFKIYLDESPRWDHGGDFSLMMFRPPHFLP